jgi:glycosyltransferase involved in cell wall biosynthesis
MTSFGQWKSQKFGAWYKLGLAMTRLHRRTPAPSAPTISVCIPTYEMHGHGAAFLARSLAALDRQSFRDFDVVVSDHSETAELAALCRDRTQFYPLRYVRCPAKRGNSSANTNFAVGHATGRIIKIVHQDDFLYHADALLLIARAMQQAPDCHWGGVGCIHVNQDETHFHTPFVPRIDPRMLQGHNGFGAPSVMFVRRESYLPFDEELIWVGDCELYFRLQQTYGPPLVIQDLCVAVRQWPKQVTHTAISEERKAREIGYAMRKHCGDT